MVFLAERIAVMAIEEAMLLLPHDQGFYATFCSQLGFELGAFFRRKWRTQRL